jgi:hypothetical protein
MKIKNILLGALLGAGLAVTTASAQGVYSQNVVGYVTVSLTNGYNLIANQLDADSSGNTNNTVSSVFGAFFPVNTYVYKWNGTGWANTQYRSSGFGPSATTNWTDPNVTINPGEGFMINVPIKTNFTFAGNVLQGTNIADLPAGYIVVANPYPTTIDDFTANYTPQINDRIMQWNIETNGWVTHTYRSSGFGPTATTNWSPVISTIQLGEGLMFAPISAKTWTNILIIQ